MTRTQMTLSILWDKGYLLYFCLALGLWVGSILFKPKSTKSLLALFAAVLTFALFDLIGYEGLHAEDKAIYPIGNFYVQSYRIIQAMFQVGLIAFIYLAFGWRVVVGFVIIHFTAGCDILYDLIGKYPVCLDYPRTWLQWTPLGWFTDSINNFWFVTQALIGLSGAIYLTRYDN